MEHCDLLELFRFFGKKWTFMIFSNINEGGNSFNEIYTLMGKKINQTLLSERLKSMQEFSIISKDNETYRLTDSGKKLKSIFHNIKEWSTNNNLIIPSECHGKECVCSIMINENV